MSNCRVYPVETKGVRIIGQAGSADHWHDKPGHFTSITELEVYSPI